MAISIEPGHPGGHAILARNVYAQATGGKAAAHRLPEVLATTESMVRCCGAYQTHQGESLAALYDLFMDVLRCYLDARARLEAPQAKDARGRGGRAALHGPGVHELFSAFCAAVPPLHGKVDALLTMHVSGLLPTA